MTKKKPLKDNPGELRIEKEIRDDMKFVDFIPLEELKLKISKEKQHPLTENVVSSEENLPKP
ncbi:hypothetical protein FQ087_15005 [Sporosarcina sp. ANT_H38]|uniref:hypothetical protein n=1 Tax=Sporosarcina sp. ANT_H38 TaxID=2597358 RepID=UPI0011F1F33D|nr:hypothetical protein [Sporosarcina sp. ANT_H38]KAA0955885.1 hypothetical protein FQ087_15005 [Sporosarcina sp. ANT_H38]